MIEIDNGMTKEEFGEWVKWLRIDSDLTQIKLAKELGLNSSQHIARIESGVSNLPKHTYKRFINVFRLDKDKFVNLLLALKKREIESFLK
jgi:transcriptional regulator with XRE-family HTH domain